MRRKAALVAGMGSVMEAVAGEVTVRMTGQSGVEGVAADWTEYTRPETAGKVMEDGVVPKALTARREAEFVGSVQAANSEALGKRSVSGSAEGAASGARGESKWVAAQVS